MIFDLLNNASYNYIQRKYYITKMEKSYEYWRIACQRDNRFIILFFYFQNVHTPAAQERKDDSLPRNLPIIILIKNIYEEKTDDFAAPFPRKGGTGVRPASAEIIFVSSYNLKVSPHNPIFL